MKMARNLIILGAITLALIVAVIFVLPNLGKTQPSAEPSASPTEDTAQLQIANLTADKVAEVTIANSKQTYTLTKSGDKYVIKGQENMELDQAAVGNVFNNVSSITANALIEQSPTDLAQYGLQAPQAKATAKYTDGTTATFLLGDKLVTGSTYYLMKQGDPRVFSVWTNVGDTYLGTADSLLIKEKFTLEQTDLDYIKVLKNGQAVVEMTTKGANSGVSITPWTIEQPWRHYVDSQQLDTYQKAILAVTMGDIVEGKPADLSKYGLDKPAYDITIGGKDTTNELLIGSDKDDSYSYAKFASGSTVYLVDKSTLGFLSTSAYTLMDKTIVLVNIQAALGVEFQGLGTNGKMVINQTLAKDESGNVKKDGNGKDMYDQTFSIDGKPIEDGLARYFYQECIGLRLHSMAANGWKPTGEAPVATLIYTRTTDPKEIKIEFLPYDKDFYAVSIDGQANFLIQQDKVKDLANKMAQLKAGTLVKPES